MFFADLSTFPCPTCGVLYTVDDLGEHRKNNHHLDPLACSFCDELLPNKQSLKSHKIIHKDENNAIMMEMRNNIIEADNNDIQGRDPSYQVLATLGVIRDRTFADNLNGKRIENFVLSSYQRRRCSQYAVSASVAEEAAETIVFPREGPGVSYGLNWALAGKGVIVKDKAFYNLKSTELKQKSGTTAESLSGLPVHVRGDVTGGASKISKAEFSKLLKQVTSHISSISEVFVQDGAVGSSSKCDAKVRVISDSPSALLSLSSVLWKTPSRAVSHDSCPLTVYVATSVSPNVGESVGLGSQANSGFVAADIERSSVILCGKAFSDPKNVKDALSAVAEPVISARGGVPLSARLLISGNSGALLFAPEDIIKSCSSSLVSSDTGVILSSHGVSPLFQTGDSTTPSLFKLPAAVILASADSSGVLPSVSKLTPGQAAYHFLAGYQNGKFVPAYSSGPSASDPLALAKSLLSKLKDQQIPSYLVNIQEGEKKVAGNELVKLVQSTLSGSIPPFEPKAGDLQSKYTSFISGKYQELPEEFSF